MARARNIKPAFFDNDDLAENAPIGRLLFIGLWTLADYKGNFIWREKRIKARILPYDNCDIKKLAINLDKSGFIRFYSDGDEMYCNVLNFTKHQNPHKNERDKGSNIPEYSDDMRQAVDLKGLTINRDKSGLIPEDSDSDRADSLLLIPDSLFPLTDSLEEKPEPQTFVCFERFWEIWPKKTDRKNAEKKWKTAKVDEDKFKLVHDHLITRKAYDFTDKQFIPNPTTYINGAKWNDEVAAPKQSMATPLPTNYTVNENGEF